jgi:hypothetical protein
MFAPNIDETIARAKTYVIQNDRNLFLPILRAIEKFAFARKMIIGGRAGTHALCHMPIDGVDVDMWILELYGLDIESDMIACLEEVTRAMKELVGADRAGGGVKERPDDIYNGDYRTIILRPSLPGREYRLFADFRLVAVGHSLGERQGIDIGGLIEPVRAPGPFGGESLLMPRDLQIMRVAHMLCDPMQAGNWASQVAQLGHLFSATDVSGGSDTDASGSSEPIGSGDERARPTFTGLASGVLIGEFAVEFYTGVAAPQRARLQYACTFEGVDEWAESKKMSVRYADMRIPDDFRMRKAILRLQKNEEIIADLFNVLAYAPVPVNKIGGKRLSRQVSTQLVAGPFAVLRFLFVDIWALSFIIKRSQDKKLASRQAFLRGVAMRLWEWIVGATSVAALFPAQYEGLYVAESVTKRRQMISARTTYEDMAPMSAVDKKELIDLGNEIIDRMQVI